MKRESFAEVRSVLGLTLTSAGSPSASWADAKPGGSSGAFETVLAEGQALGGLFTPSQLMFTAALVAAAFGLNALIQILVKFSWRLGFDVRRRWARASGLLRLLVAVLATLAVLRGALAAAPILASGFVLVLLLGALFTSGFLPNAFAGIGLTLRRRIRVGDRIKVGAHEGIVREVGLVQLYLRGSDGESVLVPNRLLNELPSVVERARNSVPVRVHLHLERKPDAAAIEQLRQIAALSPYRAPESPVDVVRDADDERRITVEIQAWSARASRDAKTQLESALRRALQ